MTMTATRPAPTVRAAAQPVQTHFDRIADVRDQLNGSLIERQQEVECLILALVSRKHVLYVGPPGTAKSLMCNGLAKAVGCKEFGILMNKFTAPEELFGPLSLTKLEQDIFQRVTTGKMPECELAFLDEVWKASSAILNTMLQIMNERVFFDGTSNIPVPLRAIIAGSNEWPIGEGHQELAAAFDRFLIRKVVKQVSPARQDDLIWSVIPPIVQVSNMADFDQAAVDAEQLPIDQSTVDAFQQIRADMKQAGLIVGDRRLRDSAAVARAAAWLDGSPDVQPKHLTALQHTLWSDPLQIARTAEIVVKIANPDSFRVLSLMSQADAIFEEVKKDDKNSGIEAITKLKTVVKDLQAISKTQSAAKKEALEALTIVNGRQTELSKAVLGL